MIRSLLPTLSLWLLGSSQSLALRAAPYPNCTGIDPSEAFYRGRWSIYDGGQLPQDCGDPSENPRGKYNADLAPCIFGFHSAPASAKGDAALSPFRLSTACTDDNLVDDVSSVNIVKEYVSDWPDDCVGSFRRCYAIPRDEKIYMKFACAKGWTFPEGTTHLSVNCTEDKALKREQKDRNNFLEREFNRSGDPRVIAQHEPTKEMKIVLAMLFVGALVASAGFCACPTGGSSGPTSASWRRD